MGMPVLWLATLLMLVLPAPYCEAYSTGAPNRTCQAMEPKHGAIKPQNSVSPYTVMVAKQVAVRGDTLQVMITSSPDGISFHGFLLQARAPDSTTPLGTFTVIPENAQYVDCGEGKQNTVTHKDPLKKKSMKFEWQSPSDYDGEVVFRATVVQDYNTFWVGLQSDVVKVADHSADGSSHSVGISTTKSPKTTTTPEPFTPETVTKAALKTDPIYDGCGKTTSCFGIPNDCVDMRNCEAIVSCLVKGTEYVFEIKAEDAKFVAVGLSDDSKMGEDSVVECAFDGSGINNVNAYMSWNAGKSNSRLNESRGIELVNASYVDGAVYCKFSREEITDVMDRTYNLGKTRYFLLLASGTSLKEHGVSYHDKLYEATKEGKYLSDVTGFTGASKLLLRLHGAFMVGAWIGSASLGILLARYFKQTWVGTQLCGKDLWFAWHRMFMLLTWSLTIVGFVLIFVDRQEWSREDNPHAILGCITTILAFIQPFGAAFRPHPESRRRPIFNWLHWLIGNVAHILAIVTIFFSGKLSKAELPDWIIWILVAYVAFHVCMHLILSITGCVSERQSGKRINSFPMKDITNSRIPLQSAERKLDAPHSCFRKCLLALYIIGILALTIAIIVIIVLAPVEKEWERLTRYISSN